MIVPSSLGLRSAGKNAITSHGFAGLLIDMWKNFHKIYNITFRILES